MKTLPFLFSILLYWSCNAEHNETEQVISGNDVVASGLATLDIAGNVDLSAPLDSAAVAPLHRFFAHKLRAEHEQDFWLQADLDRYVKPYDVLKYAEYDSQGSLKYLPTLMRVKHLSADGSRMLSVRWAAVDSTRTPADVRYVFNFLSVPTPDGNRLALPTDHLTREWQRFKVGTMNYIVSPERAFNDEEASKQQASIQKLSKIFEIQPFPVNYYSCQGPADLFRAQGFEYHFLMYSHETGGMVDFGENVWSGNDRDIYTHEIVHLFTNRKFNERQHLLDEGLATIIGGSSELDYAHHRNVLREFLNENPTYDLSEHLLTSKQEYIEEYTSVPYVIGGLICEFIFAATNKEGLFELMNTGSDPWPELNELGLSKTNLNEKLRDLLRTEYKPIFEM